MSALHNLSDLYIPVYRPVPATVGTVETSKSLVALGDALPAPITRRDGGPQSSVFVLWKLLRLPYPLDRQVSA